MRLLICLTLALAGCTDAVKLRNLATGQAVECGPYYTGMDGGIGKGIPAREAQCIADYQRQGFERTP